MINFFKKVIFFIILFFSFFLSFLNKSLAEEFKPSGPIPVTNQNPFYIFFLNPIPDGVDIPSPKKLIFDLRYTMANVNVRQYSFPPIADKDRVELDMEVHKLDLDCKYKFSERADIRLDIPYLIFWGGFLDTGVEFFEDILFVTPPTSREDSGTNRYKYFLRYSSKTYIDREDTENGFGDINCFIKYKFIDEQRRYLPSAAIRSGVKFPTGSKDDLLGSGKFDYSIGLLFQKQVNKLIMYANFDTVFIERPKVFDSMPLDDYILSGFLGFEYFLNKKISLFFQSSIMSTPYPRVGEVTSLRHPPSNIGLGCNFKFNENTSLKTSIIENCTSASPDITVQAGIKL